MAEESKLTEFRLSQIETGVAEIRGKLDELDRVYVRLERYVIIEKAVIAIFATLSLAAFGLVWQLANTIAP